MVFFRTYACWQIKCTRLTLHPSAEAAFYINTWHVIHCSVLLTRFRRERTVTRTARYRHTANRCTKSVRGLRLVGRRVVFCIRVRRVLRMWTCEAEQHNPISGYIDPDMRCVRKRNIHCILTLFSLVRADIHASTNMFLFIRTTHY